MNLQLYDKIVAVTDGAGKIRVGITCALTEGRAVSVNVSISETNDVVGCPEKYLCGK